ncbi:MAG: ATP-binding cassette domain-containing protein [Candidatus Sumerlaeaceae bacterium]
MSSALPNPQPPLNEGIAPARVAVETPQPDFVLEALGITKRYAGVAALDGVELQLRRGSIHALVGENGAGKSTLIKILSGALRPDEGTIRLDGAPAHLPNPLAARKHGINVVHQHTHLIRDLSVAENYALRQGYPRNAAQLVGWSKLRDDARAAVAPLAPTLDVNSDTRRLSAVQRQIVELSFALASTPRVLILDEPTAALPHAETLELFKRVRELAATGTAVLFVTHRLGEVFELTDHITVLRDGKLVWTKPTSEVDQDQLIRAMVGRSVIFERDETLAAGTETELSLRGLADGAFSFRGIDLQINRGEILGIYGLVGAGQSELCSALLGIRPTSDGSVSLGDADLTRVRAGKRVRRGLAYVTADRLERGVFRQMSTGENLSIASLAKTSNAGFLRKGEETRRNLESIQQLQVKTTGPYQNIQELSGGNQQKVMVGRWLRTSPRVLIVEEPTQGVDVGAKLEIHNLLRQLAREGVAILLVSSELPELLSLSHRVAVMREGQIVGELPGASASEDEILRLALPEHQKSVTKTQDHARRNTIFEWLAAKREAGLFLLLFVLWLAAVFFVPNFGTALNMRDVLLDQSILLIGALGVGAVIIAGGIDISIGAILGLAAMAAGKLDQAQQPVLLIAVVPVLLGLCLGALNGAITVFGRIHSIVVTLGMLFIFRGVMIQSMGGKWMFNLSEHVTQFGQSALGPVPMLLLVAAIVALAMHLLLGHSVSGRYLYALGGDRPSAELTGISGRKYIPIAFAVSGFLIGIAGLLHAGRYGNVQTNVGQGFELRAIAAAVIGGTHIMGGRGSVLGIVLGTLFLGFLSNVLVLLHVSSFWDNVVVGAMILLAVCIDGFTSARRESHA